MQYIELDEEMEMPCQCDCGKWFDLNNGHSSKVNERVIICQSCHEYEIKATFYVRDLKKGDKFHFRFDRYTVVKPWDKKREVMHAVTEWSSKIIHFFYEDDEVIKLKD